MQYIDAIVIKYVDIYIQQYNIKILFTFSDIVLF